MEHDAAENSRITVRSCGHTDRGLKRSLNEDSFLDRHPVYVVADGMGGHAHGDRASAAAIGAFSAALADSPEFSPSTVLDAIQQANRDVRAIARDSDDPRATSGTTLAGVALVRVGPGGSEHWMVFNVGDSRVYSWDGRTLAQLSVDHSVVQELIDTGIISRNDAREHPSRNMVTRALGASDHVDPDVWLLPAVGHQTFLICSDGLSKELIDDEIARVIVFHDTLETRDDWPQTLAERLVRAAVAAGGLDNVTVVVIESHSEMDAIAEATGERSALPSFLEDTMPRGSV